MDLAREGLWVRELMLCPTDQCSGHTGLKNNPDWSIHKLLDPYPLWRSRAAANMSEYDIFCFILPENLLILTNFLLLLVRKSGEGIKVLIYAYLKYSFGQNNRLHYGNDSYSWFTLSIDGM
jgi:hypothetical protein